MMAAQSKNTGAAWPSSRPPVARTMGDLLLASAEAAPNAEAIVFPDTRMTYAELVQGAWSTARSLAALGVRPRQNVGLLMSNCPEFIVREKHGARTRRSWRKLHLAVDANTNMIVASVLTDIASIEKNGRLGWQEETGYGVLRISVHQRRHSGKNLWDQRNRTAKDKCN